MVPTDAQANATGTVRAANDTPTMRSQVFRLVFSAIKLTGHKNSQAEREPRDRTHDRNENQVQRTAEVA